MAEPGGIRLPDPVPLLDGAVPPHAPPIEDGGRIVWRLDGGGTVTCAPRRDGDLTGLTVSAEGIGAPMSLGLRFAGVGGVRRYLRNGYQSWDGSYFVAPGELDHDHLPPAKSKRLGFAMTALLPAGGGATVLGFDRHDRFQTRFRFAGDLDIDAETLLDRTGATAGETLWTFDDPAVEPALARWSRIVAAASPLPPRVPARRLTGWCSWYNLYAAIDERLILDHLAGARAYRDARGGPLDVFLIDDGFVPEMGDWLDAKPQFPRGMAPLIADVAAAGFTPGLWIAPFLVGNRSRLFADHPDWLVRDATTGGPLVAFRFYGEFRWHKRSEEYHVLDVTHPDAAAYVSRVFATWRGWGVRYFKADFLLHGMEYGPDRARWHASGMSRVAVWRRMMALIRGSVGDDAIVAGSGSPLWASVGLVDAVRIARDVGVTWHGDYSAESLLRDLECRNHANGVLWQADPDCVLLRDRFHEMSDVQVATLARLAGGAGGVLMTSDTLDALPEARAALFADLLRSPAGRCGFPRLGDGGALIVQRLPDGREARINPTGETVEGVPPYATVTGGNRVS